MQSHGPNTKKYDIPSTILQSFISLLVSLFVKVEVIIMQMKAVDNAVALTGTAHVKGIAEGAVLSSTTSLSFWGGVSSENGDIIDHLHPLHGSSTAGKILVIPGSRGSCSGSGVILELLLNDHCPAALVFQDEELIVTLGVIIAQEVFNNHIPVIQLGAKDFETLSKAQWARIEDDRIWCMSTGPTSDHETDPERHLNLQSGPNELDIPKEFKLTAFDRDVLGGSLGKAAQVAARVILRMAAIQGATDLLDVTQAHIDGCVYTGPATLRFAEQFCEWGAKVRIPATLNSISVDKRRWQAQGIDPALGDPAGRLGDAYVKMGARPTYTCAPYLLDTAPKNGEQVIWAESNAVVYANSVLGARTMKCPDYLDICIALTGRAPNTGCHITANRQAQIKVVLPTISDSDDALFPLLGHVVGDIAANRIPIVIGLENIPTSNDDLKAFGAAFATTSSAAMFHLAGITPEAVSVEDLATQLSVTTTVAVTYADLVNTWRELNGGLLAKIDLISLGNPHFSYEEFKKLTAMCEGKVKSQDVALIVTTGRETYARAYVDGYIPALEAFGAQLVTDTCWCMIVEPLIPVTAKTTMTNSGKYAHYGAGLTGRQMRYGSLAQCIDAACSGEASHQLPSWLENRLQSAMN